MAKSAKDKKIFVLDTSVILYSHDSILNFDEHDIGIPITVLEELDTFKKGNDTKNFEAREFTRLIDKLADGHMLQNWIPLNGKTKGKFKVLMDTDSEVDATKVFGDGKNDHRIINAALALKQVERNKKVIMVSKDINLRLKAKSLNLHAEDYETGKIKNVNSLHTGKTEVENVSSEDIDALFKQGNIEKKKIFNRKKLLANEYFILKSDKNSVLARYRAPDKRIEKVDKMAVYGIKPKNAEQTFAIQAMLDPEIRLVTVNGVAGTGKTLIALASAMEQKKH